MENKDPTKRVNITKLLPQGLAGIANAGKHTTDGAHKGEPDTGEAVPRLRYQRRSRMSRCPPRLLGAMTTTGVLWQST
jgi:hypothetical protein